MTTKTPQAIRVSFKSGDEAEFQKPDHDPHGETFAAAAHSSTSCDGENCSASGLVPTNTLDFASGFIDDHERDVLCSTCFEHHLFDRLVNGPAEAITTG